MYLDEMTVPLLFQMVTQQDTHLITSREGNFVVECTSATPLTAADLAQAEVALRGKPIAAETALMRCVQTIAATCLAQSQPMIEQFARLRPDTAKVSAAVVLDGHIRWHKKPPRH